MLRETQARGTVSLSTALRCGRSRDRTPGVTKFSAKVTKEQYCFLVYANGKLQLYVYTTEKLIGERCKEFDQRRAKLQVKEKFKVERLVFMFSVELEDKHFTKQTSMYKT